MNGERELRLRKNPERNAAQPSIIPDRLALSYQSRIHFEEAVVVAVNSNYEVRNALMDVGRRMTEAGIAPVSVLERQGKIHVLTKTKMEHARDTLGNTNIFPVSLKPFEENTALWSVNTHIYAAETLLRQGEDPTPILEQAMDKIAKGGDMDQISSWKYAKIARVFHEAGIDPKIAFSRAEDHLSSTKEKTAKKIDVEVYSHMIEGYADCGLFDNALGMVDDVGLQYDRFRKLDLLQYVLDAQLKQRDINGATETAKKIERKDVDIKTKAYKALVEAERGDDPSQTISEISKSIIFDPNDLNFKDDLIDAAAIIGIAWVKAGNLKEASRQFTFLREQLDQMESIDQYYSGFRLVTAIDDAGFDAEDAFREFVVWANDFAKEYSNMPSKKHKPVIPDDNEETQEMIRRGYLNLAREYIYKWPRDPGNAWNDSKLIAELAKGEAKAGLSQAEIDSLSTAEIKQLLSGAESVRQAALFFGLDKKIA